MEQSRSRPWWQDGVIYQVYPRSFKDTNEDGVGDLAGVIEKLDYLNDGSEGSLGVDAIWLSPFYPSPLADFGYDVADYCAVDPALGDLQTFDRLVAEAKRRGLRVILDFVPNHTSNQHPWFAEARSGRGNPRRDWYIWRDPRPGGGLPNNWGSVFGGPAWTWDEASGQYYFHQFLKEQPDLNWRNPEVRAAMLDVLRFWLERGVDGFRMDVIGMIYKHPDMPDQPLDPNAPADLRPDDLYSRQQHLYDQDQPEVVETVREMRRLGERYGEICLIGEVLWHGLDRWARYYGSQGDGLHLPMNFSMLELPWRAGAFRAAVAAVEKGIPPQAWPTYVLGNHDEGRLASRWGAAQARVAAMLLLTLRGTPLLYYGDEIGMENGIIRPEAAQDPWGINLGPERNRDVCRTPMQWDGAAHAGFSSARPWLPVSADYEQRNAQAQSADAGSMLNLYRQLIWLRRGSPALRSGSYQAWEAGSACFAYLRQDGVDVKFVALNFSGEEARAPLPGPGCVALSTYLDRAGEALEGAAVLRPNEGIVVELRAPRVEVGKEPQVDTDNRR